MNRYFKNEFNCSPKKVNCTRVFLCSFFCVKGKTIWQNQMHAKKGNLSNPVPQLQNGFCFFGQLQVLKEFQKNISSYHQNFGSQRKRKGKVAYEVK